MATFFGLLTLLLLVVMVAGLINPSLARNRKSGEIPSRGKIAGSIGLLAFVSLVVAGVTTSESAPKAASPVSAAQSDPTPKAEAISDNRIKPETIVTFPKGEAACLTKEALQQFIELAGDNKATKANALFDPSGDGPLCIMLPPTKRYKVIDAEYNAPDMPDAGVLEVVGEKVKASESGAFVLVVDKSMVKIVKAPTDAPVTSKDEAATYDPIRAQRADVDAVWQSTLTALAHNTRQCIDGYTSQTMRGYAVAHRTIDKDTIINASINRCAQGYIQNAVLHHFKTKEEVEEETSAWATLAYDNELARGQ